MTRRLRALALLLAGVVVAACGPAATPTPSASSGSGLPASPVDGVIVAVDASGLSDVRGFTLRLADGSTIAFKLGTLENPTQFAPGHLKEHEATSQPVRAYFTPGPDGPVVYRLEDAPPAAT